MQCVELPTHLRGVFFDFRWETAKIWSLPTPASFLGLDALLWHLDLTVWTTVQGKARFDLAPATVLAAPDLYPRQTLRIQQAQLSFPLELFQRNHQWVIVDGYHRLCRHWLLRNRYVPVRLHPDEFWDRVRIDVTQ